MQLHKIYLFKILFFNDLIEICLRETIRGKDDTIGNYSAYLKKITVSEYLYFELFKNPIGLYHSQAASYHLIILSFIAHVEKTEMNGR